jgi:hypothetical protein
VRQLSRPTGQTSGAQTLPGTKLNPRILDRVDQAETYDESAENLTGDWFDRNLEYKVRTV